MPFSVNVFKHVQDYDDDDDCDDGYDGDGDDGDIQLLCIWDCLEIDLQSRHNGAPGHMSSPTFQKIEWERCYKRLSW